MTTERRRPVPSRRFYGRAREKSRIDSAIEQALVDREPRLVLVSGAPGVGKSALVDLLVQDPRAELFAQAKARPELRDTPLGALVVDDPSTEVRAWTSVLASLRANLDGVTEGKVAVLVVDDLQWIDVATIHLISELVATSSGRALVLVGIHRDGMTAEAFPRLLHIVPRETLTLPPLELEDIERLVADSLESDPVTTSGLARLVHQRTGGNPLFAGQLLLSLAEEGALVHDDLGDGWRWDDERVRKTEYSANVLELVGSRLHRLSPEVARALEFLACLGFATDTRILTAAWEGSLDELHAALWTAATATSIVYRSPTGYTFLHDRVREAAYERIPIEERAERHLAIGRRLLAHLEPRLPGDVFVVLDHLDRALPLLRTKEERALVARLNQDAVAQSRAARDWRAAIAYARVALELADGDPFEPTMLLAEMEMLSGLSDAGRLDRLLGLADTRLRELRVFALFSNYGSLAEHHEESVDTFRRALDRFGIVLAEAEPVVDVTRLFDLPPGADPEAAQVIEVLVGALPMLRIGCPELHPQVTWTALALAERAGWTPALTALLGNYALLLAGDVGRIAEARDLVDRALDLDARRNDGRHRGALLYTRTFRVEPVLVGRMPSREAIEAVAKACMALGDVRFLGWVAFEGAWLALMREPLDVAIELAGSYAAYTAPNCAAATTARMIKDALLRMATGGGPLVSREEARRIQDTGYRPGMAVLALLELFNACLERRVADALPALEAAEKEASVLAGTVYAPSYELLRALVLAAARDSRLDEAIATMRRRTRDARPWHLELAAAEQARVEGRALDAMHGYEGALRVAHARDALSHQALTCELAARFYRERGFPGIALGYLRTAVAAYRRWGAHARAALVEHDWLALQYEARAVGSVIVGPDEQLDVQALVHIARVASDESAPDGVLRLVVESAVEHVHVSHASIFLRHGGELRIAHAAVRRDGAMVVERGLAATLDDVAAVEEVFVSARLARRGDVAHVPLVRRGVVLAVLRTEAVDERRQPLLELLAAQGATALGSALDAKALRTESAERQRLDEDLLRSRTLLEVAESLSKTGTFVWMPASNHYLHWSKEMRRIGGFDHTPTLGETFERTHPEDRSRVSGSLERGSLLGTDIAFDHRFLLPDGTVRHVQTRARKIRSTPEIEYAGVAVDVTERQLAEEALHRTRDELSHANRVTTVGELASSIAHEINQPLAAIMADASAATHWLAAATPNLDAVRESLASIERDGMRVSEILNRIRALLSRRAIAASPCDLLTLIHGVVALLRPELARTSVEIDLALHPTPMVEGDVVQLQQVLINLVINARDACRELPVERRRLVIRTETTTRDGRSLAHLAVVDAGPGLGPDAARVFEPFFTTKTEGLGMGLAISRSIVERHGGKLWGETNEGAGATFHVVLPALT